MRSQVISSSYSVEQVDVLYVAQQINRDLQSLSKAYPRLISIDRVLNLFNSYVTLLHNKALAELGFSIHDPSASNLVYHEYRYKVLYGGEVIAVSPDGRRMGTGGRPVKAVWIPSTARFAHWVIWSQGMLNLSESAQQRILSGTDWSIPGRNLPFNATYKGGSWNSSGSYASGRIGVSGKEYRKD